MRKVTRRFASRLALTSLAVLVAAPLLFPGLALAQYREFTGRIDTINSKKMIVDNRKGDKVTFNRVDGTEVADTSGEDKKSWGDLKKKDWVTVSWKFIDKPRKAYKIVVLPKPEDDD